MKIFRIIILVLGILLSIQGIIGTVVDISGGILEFSSIAIESIFSAISALLIVIVLAGRMQASRFGQLVAAVVSVSFFMNIILALGFAVGMLEQGNPNLVWFIPLVPAVIQSLFLIYYLRS